MINIDNSQINTFLDCPKKYYWRNIKHLVPVAGSTALRFGQVWHLMMEEYYKNLHKSKSELIESILQQIPTWYQSETAKFDVWYEDYRNQETLCTMFLEYINRYYTDLELLIIESTEIPFCININEYVNFTGRIDLIVNITGQKFIVDHKTTGQYIATAVKRVERSHQLIGYCYAHKKIRNEEPFGYVVFTCHASSRKKVNGEYGKLRTEFNRSIISINSNIIDIWYNMFNYNSANILSCRTSNIWPVNYDSCFKYGRCSYYDLCQADRDGSSNVRIIENKFKTEAPYDPSAATVE